MKAAKLKKAEVSDELTKLWQKFKESPNGTTDSETEAEAPPKTFLGYHNLQPLAPGMLTTRKLEQFKISFRPGAVTCTSEGRIFVCENYGSALSGEMYMHMDPWRPVRYEKVQRNFLQVPIQTKRGTEVSDAEVADSFLLLADRKTKSLLFCSLLGTDSTSIPVDFHGAAGVCVYQYKLYLTSTIENKIYTLDWPHCDNQKVFLENCDSFNTELRGPRFIAANGNNVAVSCSLSNTVLMYDKYGTLQFSYSGQGSPKGDLGEPWGIVIDSSGRLIINDFGKNCVHFVSPQGEYLDLIDLEKVGLLRPTGLALNGRGQLIIAAWWSKQVAIYEYTF